MANTGKKLKAALAKVDRSKSYPLEGSHNPGQVRFFCQI